MSRETQHNFDWNRARRQNWLDHLDIPRFDRVEAGGEIRLAHTTRMKHLLRVIESFARDGGSWTLHLETIAERMGCSVKTVSRIVTDCEVRGLMTVQRDEGRASTYAILWAGVKEILLANPKTAGLVEERKRSKTDSQPVAKTTPDNVTDTPDNLSQTPDNLSGTPDNLSDTPDNLSTVFEGDTTSSRARGLKPCIQPCSQPSIKPCNVDSETIDFPGYHGWPFEVELKHLRDANQVQRLWEHALDCGYVQPDCRIRFFALAICVAEMVEVRNHGGFFTKRVKQRKWLGSRIHIRRAIEAIERLDRDDIQPAAGKQPTAAPSKNVADAIDKLRKRFAIGRGDDGKTT